MSSNPEPAGVTSFRISPENLDMWMHQNEAEYTGAFVEGSLLNNFVLACKRGFAAVYEHYLNCWSSDYLIEFQPGAAQDVWKNWYNLENWPKANKNGEEQKMGTRNLVAVQIDGQYKIAQYGQWGGYPEGKGVDALTFLRDRMDEAARYY